MNKYEKAWREKYFPIPASDVKTLKEAIKHAYRKYSGLTKKNQAKYKITFFNNYFWFNDEKSELDFGFYNCAFCKIVGVPWVSCDKCPFVIVFQKECCQLPGYQEAKQGNPTKILTEIRKIAKHYKVNLKD